MDELVREGARRMIQEAIDSEVEAFIERHSGRVDQLAQFNAVCDLSNSMSLATFEALDWNVASYTRANRSISGFSTSSAKFGNTTDNYTQRRQ